MERGETAFLHAPAHRAVLVVLRKALRTSKVRSWETAIFS